MKYLHLLLPVVCLIGPLAPLKAAEEPDEKKAAKTSQIRPKTLKAKPSKVSAAKGRDREKLFTDWMSQNDLIKLNDLKIKTGEQMIYYEYHEGKRLYRAIHGKVSFNGTWWVTQNGEKEMQDTVETYVGRGYTPLFITLERNYYCMLFVQVRDAGDLATANGLLKAIGVEPPVMK